MSAKLLIDYGAFLARSLRGYTEGVYSVPFNFVRQLRVLVEQHCPSEIVVVHGSNLDDFLKSKSQLVLSILKALPVNFLQAHASTENILHHLVERERNQEKALVICTTNELCMQYVNYDHYSNVNVWNLDEKNWMHRKFKHIVAFKALNGDETRGWEPLVEHAAEASLYSEDMEALGQFMDKHPEYSDLYFERCNQLRFRELTSFEQASLKEEQFLFDEAQLRSLFQTYGFHSLLQDKYWSGFCTAFHKLAA